MKIEEIAREYGKVNYIVRYTADGEKEIDEETGAEFFEDGANYVLEQVEKLIYEKHVEGNLPLFDLTHLIDKLKEK